VNMVGLASHVFDGIREAAIHDITGRSCDRAVVSIARYSATNILSAGGAGK
jgi:hypothetical protein